MSVRTIKVWLFWLGMYVLTTAFLYSISALPDIRVAHALLGYLVLIIAASRHGGRALSMTLVVLSYAALDWFYVPPRFTLLDASHLDWLVLLGFVAAGWMISQLFATEREARRIAEERTIEVERLSRERLQLEELASMARVLKEADRLKNALLSSVAHDLRSPAATLSLLSDPASGFPPDQALHRVGEEATRLTDFISTLQRFASDGGGALLSWNKHAVESLVQTAVKSSEAMLTGRTVNLPADIHAFTVGCDFTLSVQVLGNLLQNAARYSPATSPIDLFVRNVETWVEIVVADRGVGVEGDVEKLFTPLRRRPQETEVGMNDARMGMGLSIARTFARAQRGDVRYRPREGGGSEFTLRLPRGLESVPPSAI